MAGYATTEKQYQCKNCLSIIAWRHMRREIQITHVGTRAHMHCPKCDKLLINLTSENYEYVNVVPMDH